MRERPTVGPGRAQTDVPEGWNVTADTGEASEVEFVTMEPGWHVTTGPAALLYDPDRTAPDAGFRVEATFHRFPGEASGYGIFFAGRGLEPDAYDFVEVLLDADGRVRVAHLAGPDVVHDIVPWSSHEAVATPSGEEPTRNRLVLDVAADRVALRIGSAEVISFERPEYARFDGVVGLRMLSDVDVHVSGLDLVVEAPAR